MKKQKGESLLPIKDLKFLVPNTPHCCQNTGAEFSFVFQQPLKDLGSVFSEQTFLNGRSRPRKFVKASACLSARAVGAQERSARVPKDLVMIYFGAERRAASYGRR